MTHTGQTRTVAVFEAEDGVLLLGSEGTLALVDQEYDVSSRALSPTDLARIAGHVGSAAGQLSAQSGRWLKLTKESAQHLETYGRTSVGKSGVLPGVLRDGTGRFAKQLRFEDVSKAGLLTPAAPAVLGALATQYALESAMDDITAYLETIDEKLDRLLKQRRIEALGQLGGVASEIDEAATIFAETGRVSPVTWSKVQAASLALKTMQHEALSQLGALAEDVAATAGDADKTAKRLRQAQDDAQFWLGVLGRTIALQDRQYALELARVSDDDVEQLGDHRRGITVARRGRLERIAGTVESISRAVADAASLTNAAKVANPINAPRVAIRANTITHEVTTFAAHAQLEMRQADGVLQTPWLSAARDLARETGAVVGSAGAGVAERARAAGRAVESAGAGVADRARAAGRAAGTVRETTAARLDRLKERRDRR